MTEGPRRLNLEAEIECPHVAAATAAAIGACRAGLSLPTLLGWREGEDGPLETQSLPQVVRCPVSLVFVADTDYGLVLPGDEPDRFRFTLNWVGEAGAESALDARRAVLGALAAQRVLRQAVVRRHLGGHCLPVLPLVEDATHLLACRTEAVGSDYAGAEGFAAAWDQVDQVGGVAIFARAMDATGNPDFLRRVLPGHMAMARLARPGRVAFYPPQFAEGEFAVLDAGEPTLTGVGYHPREQVYEFAGHTPPGTELRCIDVLNAWRLASEGRLDDGRPVREVRAVFMNRNQAARGFSLLHAAGIAVFFEDERGKLQALRG